MCSAVLSRVPAGSKLYIDQSLPEGTTRPSRASRKGRTADALGRRAPAPARPFALENNLPAQGAQKLRKVLIADAPLCRGQAPGRRLAPRESVERGAQHESAQTGRSP